MKHSATRLSIIIILFMLIPTRFELQGQHCFSLHVGNAIPVGYFASNNFNNPYAAGATTGIGVDLKYLHYSNDSSLGIYLSLGLNINGLKQVTKDQIYNTLDTQGVAPSTDYYKFINLPVMAGINLPLKVNDNMVLWAEGSLGINLLKITPLTIYWHNQRGTLSFSPSFKFAFCLGGGITMLDRYIVGLYYYNLGTHSPRHKLTLLQTTTIHTAVGVKATMVSFKFGVKL